MTDSRGNSDEQDKSADLLTTMTLQDKETIKVWMNKNRRLALEKLNQMPLTVVSPKLKTKPAARTKTTLKEKNSLKSKYLLYP